MKWWMIFILIGMNLFNGIVALPESPQAVQDPQIERALTEARQVSTELAEKVRSLLFQEIEKGGFVRDDHAIGFLVGDVRGAITVKIPLPPRK